MLINYLKTAVRTIRKAPVYGSLNIAGLSLGIACAALIFLWIEDELGFNHQYAKRNELYSIRMNIGYNGKIESYTSVPGPMPAAIRGTIPGIVNNSRIGFGLELFRLNDKSTYEAGFYVDTSFFSMMQLNFEKGNASRFSNLNTLVLSERFAKKYFGEENPLGKTLRVNNQQDFEIIGVVSNPPRNVSMQFDWLAPIDNFLNQNQWLNSWGTYGINTLVELNSNASVKTINEQLTAILRPKDKQFANANCELWSMLDWHLYNRFTNGKQDGGQIRYVKMFSTIAWIILIIACINFMNLATARAGKRAREIGVRKTLGAVRNALIGQFILEALVLSFIAVLVAILLVYLLLPGFNTLVAKQLPFDLFSPSHIIGLLVIGTFCGLVAGSYPAFYLSSFNPVAVLKGQRLATKAGATFIRKGLVIIQFTVSIILIISTVIIYQQIQHIKKRDLGYNKNNLLYTETRGDLVLHFDAIKAQLLETGDIENASLNGSPPLSMWGTVTSNQLNWQGMDPDNKIKISWESASPEYISTMGIKIIEGRNFYPDIKSDSGSVIINERLAGLMGQQGHVGATLTYNNTDHFHIVGIIKDFLFNDMYQSVTPLLLTCDPEVSKNYLSLVIRLKPGIHLPATINKIERILKANNPGYPFTYQFIDDRFDQLFMIETQIGELAGVFATLAILISCLGLFGLAAYTAERRTREIGIRKVLGASTSTLFALLSKEFLQLVLLSCLIAFPLAWRAMNNWLADYAYRTAIHWWVFLMAGIAAVMIALFAISFQAIKTTRANPVKSIKSE